MKCFLTTLILIWTTGAQADDVDWTVNSVLGDASWIAAHGTAPTADTPEVARLSTHLRFVGHRLAGRDVTHLSAEQRVHRQRLLAVLADYAEEGRFPQRDADEYTGRRPLFIDAQGVHCAVGYLMAQSGAEALAQSIAARENYAYVSQIETPGVSEWASAQGLSADELAMIQPSYGFEQIEMPAPPTAESVQRRIEEATDTATVKCAREHTPVSSFRIRVRGATDGTVRIRAWGRNNFVACFTEHMEAAAYINGPYTQEPQRYRFRMRVQITSLNVLLARSLRASNVVQAGRCMPTPGEVPLYARVSVRIDDRIRIRVRTWPRNVEVAQCLADHLAVTIPMFTPGVWRLHAEVNLPVGPAMSELRLEQVVRLHAPNIATNCLAPGATPSVLTIRVVARSEADEFAIRVNGAPAYTQCVREGLQLTLQSAASVYWAPNPEPFFRIDADAQTTVVVHVETREERDGRVMGIHM